jgi:hypothetical protein
MKSKPPSIEPPNILNILLGGSIGIASIIVPLFGITQSTTTIQNTNPTLPLIIMNQRAESIVPRTGKSLNPETGISQKISQ